MINYEVNGIAKRTEWFDAEDEEDAIRIFNEEFIRGSGWDLEEVEAIEL